MQQWRQANSIPAEFGKKHGLFFDFRYFFFRGLFVLTDILQRLRLLRFRLHARFLLLFLFRRRKSRADEFGLSLVSSGIAGTALMEENNTLNQSINPSINPSINQSINQRKMHVEIGWKKRTPLNSYPSLSCQKNLQALFLGNIGRNFPGHCILLQRKFFNLVMPILFVIFPWWGNWKLLREKRPVLFPTFRRNS